MNKTLEKRLGKERVFLLETLYQARSNDELYSNVLADIVEQSDLYSDSEMLELDLTRYQLMRPKNRIVGRLQDEMISEDEEGDFELLLKSASMPLTMYERKAFVDDVVQRQGYEGKEELWSRYEQWQKQRLEDGNRN